MFVRYNLLFSPNFPGDDGFAGSNKLGFPLHTRMYNLASDHKGIPVSKYDRNHALLPAVQKKASKKKKKASDDGGAPEKVGNCRERSSFAEPCASTTPIS
jgi:hypothetical protein